MGADLRLFVEPLRAAVDLLMKRAVPNLRFSTREPRFPQAGLSLLQMLAIASARLACAQYRKIVRSLLRLDAPPRLLGSPPVSPRNAGWSGADRSAPAHRRFRDAG
jgi:hypothetical protein